VKKKKKGNCIFFETEKQKVKKWYLVTLYL